MSISENKKVRAIELRIVKDYLEVFLEDGRIFFVPLEWYPTLASASKKSLQNFRLIGKGLGIHWPELDEDLSIDGFLHSERNLAQPKKALSQRKSPSLAKLPVRSKVAKRISV